MRTIARIIYRILILVMNLALSEEKWWQIRQNLKDNKYGKAACFVQKGRYKQFLRDAGSDIPIEAEFSEKPAFPHGVSGIYISKGARVGKNCTILQQVTIGSNTIKGSKGYGSPTIGDDVFIGAGAKIIGNVQIGNHVRVGANCIVVEDIGENCTVVMTKPHVIHHGDTLDNTFIPIDNTDITGVVP